jgi:hypothetical protein
LPVSDRIYEHTGGHKSRPNRKDKTMTHSNAQIEDSKHLRAWCLMILSVVLLTAIGIVASEYQRRHPGEATMTATLLNNAQ